MKKAFVLLLALAILGGAVFAQEASVSGDATLSWGIDLDTQATGFMNEANVSIYFPLFAEATVTTEAEGDVYGYIEIEDLAWELGYTNDGSATWLGDDTIAGSITAKLVFKPFELSVFNAPDIGIDYIASYVPTGDVAYTTPGMYGTTFSYLGEGMEFGVSVLSADDWTGNVDNDYALGANFSFDAVVDVLTINGAVAYDLAAATSTVYAGLEAPVTLAIMNGLEITPAADFAIGDDLSFDLGASVALYLSEMNDDDEQTTVAFGAYYSNVDEEAEIQVSFDEYLVGGMVENAEFGVAFTLYDFLDAVDLPWTVETYAGYDFAIDDMSSLYGRVDFDIDYTEAKNLTVLVEFTNVSVANTTFTVTYESGNLLADPDAVLGTIIAAAMIEL